MIIDSKKSLTQHEVVDIRWNRERNTGKSLKEDKKERKVSISVMLIIE